MVLFSAMLPKFFQSLSGVFAEKAAEIGRIIESKLKSNLFSRPAAGIQKPFAFIDHPVSNEF